MILAWISICIAITAGISLYLAAPHGFPSLCTTPRLALAAGGWALLGIGTAGALEWNGATADVFVSLAFALAVWSVAPVLAAWLGRA